MPASIHNPLRTPLLLVRGEVTKRRIHEPLHSGRDILDARPATAFRAAAPRVPQSVHEHLAARSLPATATPTSPGLPLKLQPGRASWPRRARGAALGQSAAPRSAPA